MLPLGSDTEGTESLTEAVIEGSLERKAESVTTESETKEIIYLLKAILAGIEIIADQDAGSLIEDIDQD